MYMKLAEEAKKRRLRSMSTADTFRNSSPSLCNCTSVKTSHDNFKFFMLKRRPILSRYVFPTNPGDYEGEMAAEVYGDGNEISGKRTSFFRLGFL